MDRGLTRLQGCSFNFQLQLNLVNTATERGIESVRINAVWLYLVMNQGLVLCSKFLRSQPCFLYFVFKIVRWLWSLNGFVKWLSCNITLG